MIIPHTRFGLRAPTREVGEYMNATFVDVTAAVTDYFDLMTREWQSGVDFVLCEQDVRPTPQLVDEMWECDSEWCTAFFWAWEGAIADGESRPQCPRRHKVSATLALNKFGADLLLRAPGAMRDAAGRTNGVRHFNMLDLVLVGSGGVLQSWPYNARPHIHGPVDHRTPPAWVSSVAEDQWVDG